MLPPGYAQPKASHSTGTAACVEAVDLKLIYASLFATEKLVNMVPGEFVLGDAWLPRTIVDIAMGRVTSS